jgi:prepilin-type N-terminal cleavage/methylation domain-containing protein
VTRRAGFTIIELLITLIIIGILANIAIPMLRVVKTRADAARVLSDFDIIRGAAYDVFASHDSFPPSGNFGQVPPQFVQSLPAGFQFQYKDVNYRWQLLGTPQGNPLSPGQPLLGLEVQSANTELMNAIFAGYHGALAFGGPNDFTLVIE